MYKRQGKQLMQIGMLVVLDSILNRITQNRAKGKNTFIFIDEIYLLFQHEYSANFLFTCLLYTSIPSFKGIFKILNYPVITHSKHLLTIKGCTLTWHTPR